MSLVPAPRAVVTGAGGGLGRALCQEIVRCGGRVVASDVDLDAARATVGSLGSAEAHAIGCDVTKLGSPATWNVGAQQRMAGAKIQADGVARIALDGVARGALYVLPHPDGRWLWRLKRTMPRAFHALTPKLLALRSRT
jgi:NAD(P)-dependent dehydrogenase (short-subunit alcohol dehydrogenase family)